MTQLEGQWLHPTPSSGSSPLSARALSWWEMGWGTFVSPAMKTHHLSRNKLLLPFLSRE